MLLKVRSKQPTLYFLSRERFLIGIYNIISRHHYFDELNKKIKIWKNIEVPFFNKTKEEVEETRGYEYEINSTVEPDLLFKIK